jgi:HK97 gp10 family phage protein
MAIETKGIAEMKARMRSLSQQVSGPIAKKAVRAGGKVIRDAMIERTPELIEKNTGSDALEPGAVKADIKVRFPAAENKYEATALIGPGSKTSHVARWVEYGHRMVSGGQSKVLANGKVRGPGKVHEQDVPAYPFLRPAFEESVAEAQAAEVETLRSELQKVRL